jgi:hypothetical protein
LQFRKAINPKPKEVFMALKDIKSITVAPGEEDSTMNLWQSFGWEMKSTQEVKTSESSHLERRGDTIYNVTKAGDHYIKITFERDQSRQNYKELVALENQYYNVSGPGQKPIRIGRIGCVAFPLFVLAVWMFSAGVLGVVDGKIALALAAIVLSLIFFVPGFVMIKRRVKSYPDRRKSWEEASEAFVNEREDVLKQARGIINQS